MAVVPIWPPREGGHKPPVLTKIELAGSKFFKEHISSVESIEKLIGRNQVFIHLKSGERILVDADKNTVLSLLR